MIKVALLYFALLPAFSFAKINPFENELALKEKLNNRFAEKSFHFSNPDQTICSELKGIVIADSVEHLNSVSVDSTCRLAVSDLQIPGGREKLEYTLSPFFEQPLTERKIKEIKSEIARFYQNHNFPFMSVIVPEQDLSSCCLKLIIIEGRLGNIEVKGNRYTSRRTICKAIRLQEGEPINQLTLMRDLSWLNTNPYRRVNALFRAGESHGLTDIDLVVNDRRRWRYYLGGDNTGTPVIGRTRWFTGLNLENIFLRDHILSFQFTTANEFREFKSYTFQYSAPLPWRNTLSVFGAYADVHVPRSADLKTHGKTYQLSGRYSYPQWFNKQVAVDQITADVGFDFKGTNNNVVFQDTVVDGLGRLTWIGQFTGSFYLDYDRGGYKWVGGIDLFWSPGPMFPHQSVADFSSLRDGATAHYFYSRFLMSCELPLSKGFFFSFRGRGQLANSPLLPSEQFAAGGYNTVRGYDERVANGDDAFCLNFEFSSPIFPLIGEWICKVKDRMNVLLFVDAAKTWDLKKVSGFPLSQDLVGIGGGLRYQISSVLMTRCDLGFPILSVVNDSGKPRIHFSAVLSY